MLEKINKSYLKEKQYKTTKYLEARIKIHEFTENKRGFHEWIFDKLDMNSINSTPIKILDVACGISIFWKKNQQKFKNKKIDITLTDFSDEMLVKSKENTKDINFNNINFEIADMEKLKKYYNNFDIVFCHNAVYHAEDKKLALNNLKNCLNDKKSSFVSITTNSEKHMLNIYTIGRSLDKKFPTDRLIDSWTEEVADKMLPSFFDHKKIIEEEKLKVTDLKILKDYVASAVEPRGIVLRDDFYDEYSSIAKKEIDEKGYFQIIKRSPLYICKKN